MLTGREQIKKYLYKHKSWENCDEYEDGSYGPDEYHDQSFYYIGKHSTMNCWKRREVYQHEEENNETLHLEIYGKLLYIKSGNLKDIFELARAEDYVISRLRKLGKEEALKSPLYVLKQKIENNLKDISKGETEGLNFDLNKELGQKALEDIKEIDDRGIVEGKIYRAIEDGLIPPETIFRKYPRDLKTFEKRLPKISERYKKYIEALEKEARVKSSELYILSKREIVGKLKEKIKDNKALAKINKKFEKKELEESIYEAKF